MQWPGFLNLQALRGAQFVVGIDAGKANLGFFNDSRGAGVNLDQYRARNLFVGCFRQLDRDCGTEVAQSTDQLSYVGIGCAQQSCQLPTLQVGLVTKALELQVLLQQ